MTERAYSNCLLGFKKTNEHLRLTELESFIYQKNKNKKYSQYFKEAFLSNNSIGISSPFYSCEKQKKHPHEGCNHQCVGCIYKKSLMRLQTKAYKRKGLKTNINSNFYRVATNRETFKKQQHFLPRVNTQLKKQTLKRNNFKNSSRLEKQFEQKLKKVKEKLLPQILKSYKIKNLKQQDKIKVEGIIKQYLRDMYKQKILKSHLQNTQRQQKFQEKEVTQRQENFGKNQKIQAIHRELRNQINVDRIHNFIERTHQIVQELGNIFTKYKKKVKYSYKTQRKARKKSITESKLKGFPNIKIHEWSQEIDDQKLNHIINQIVLLKKKQFKQKICQITSGTTQKLKDFINHNDNDENLDMYKELYEKIQNRTKMMEKILEEANISPNQRQKKKSIIEKYLKKVLLSQKKIEYLKIPSIKASEEKSSSSIRSFEDNQFYQRSKSNKSKRSIKFRKKNSNSELLQQNQLSSNSDSLLDQGFSKATNDLVGGFQPFKQRISNRQMRSSRILPNSHIFSEEQSKRSSLHSIKIINEGGGVQIKHYQSPRESKKSTLHGIFQGHQLDENQIEKNLPKIRKVKKKNQEEGDKNTMARTINNNKNNFANPSKYKKQFQAQKNSKHKENKAHLAKQNLHKHKDLIDYAQKYLKSFNLESLIIHEHNGIFMKKKKIRHLKEILKTKFQLQQIDNNILQFLLNYLSIFEENCKLIIGNKNSKESSQLKCQQKDLNLLRNKDYYQRLYFYDLDQKIDLEELIQHDFTFKETPETHQNKSYTLKIPEIISQIQKQKQCPKYEYLMQIDLNSKACFLDKSQGKVQENENGSETTKYENILNEIQKYKFSPSSAFAKVKKLLNQKRMKSSENDTSQICRQN